MTPIDPEAPAGPSLTSPPAAGSATRRRRFTARHLAGCAGLLTLLLVLHGTTGRLNLVTVPDSPSYSEYPFDALPAALSQQRPPGYPLMVRLVAATCGLAWLPLVQLLLHAAASGWLIHELGRWGTPPPARWAAGLAVAIGCTVWDNGAMLATDAPAASLGVLTAVALMRWARLDGRKRDALPVALSALTAIAMRPSYLFLIPWVGLAGILLLYLRRRNFADASSVGDTSSGDADFGDGVAADPVAGPTWPGGGNGGSRRDRPRLDWRLVPAASWAVLGIVLPLVAWIALRGWVVGDPRLLPFGHQNLVGLTIQWVSDEELLDTPEPIRRLAEEILIERSHYLESGGRFAEGAAGATMTIEARWDDYVWYVVVPAAERLNPGDPIASHNAIRQLNRELLRRYPARYIRWLLLASRRAAWGIAANAVMHPPFLLAIGLLIACELFRILAGYPPPTSRADAGLDALLVIAISYAALKVALVIATSPPLGRFADAAAIFLPAWLAAVGVLRIARMGRDAPAG